MRHLLLLLAFALSACGKVGLPGSDSGSTASSRPKQKVLVIGDSISLGWTPFMAMKTGSEFEWYRLTAGGYGREFTWHENAANTNYTLRNVTKWLDERPQMDVVVWNNGIWNCTTLGYFTPGADPNNYGTTAEQYERELIEIAKIIKARVPRVIFNTTTKCKQRTPEPERNEVAFNEIAKRVLPGLGVEIFDLYTLTKDHDGENGHDQWWLYNSTGEDVHFNSIGNEYITEEMKKLFGF